jgi:hypothetical protein
MRLLLVALLGSIGWGAAYPFGDLAAVLAVGPLTGTFAELVIQAAFAWPICAWITNAVLRRLHMRHEPVEVWGLTGALSSIVLIAPFSDWGLTGGPEPFSGSLIRFLVTDIPFCLCSTFALFWYAKRNRLLVQRSSLLLTASKFWFVPLSHARQHENLLWGACFGTAVITSLAEIGVNLPRGWRALLFCACLGTVALTVLDLLIKWDGYKLVATWPFLVR